MLLREFFTISDDTGDFINDRRYDSRRDNSVIEFSDTRKIRLTLKQINQMRIATEAHEAEKQSELGLIRKMYANPVQEAQAPAA